MNALNDLQFGNPEYLWLLSLPALLAPFAAWNLLRWRRDRRALLRHRVTPVGQLFGALGPWPFWCCLLLALTCAVLALSRPALQVARLRTAGIDLIVLQDGSASMHVRDIGMTRWQQSMQFVRTLAESLEWRDDRMALALFARIAAPQVRLTRDPNTIFFFLDHLSDESPFPLKDDTTWDTNIELGIHWGLRLLDRDEALNGASDNAKAFVLISDGQAWSGEVQAAMAQMRSRGLPVFVVGVGTQTGGLIPEPPPDPFGPRPAAGGPIRSALDRPALQAIATAGRGAYFDLASGAATRVAGSIVGAARRRAGPRGVERASEELYWWCLLAAAAFLCVGACFIRDLSEARLQAFGAAAALTILYVLLR